MKAENEAVASATDIWYKGQRVLRSIVGALVLLVPIVNGAAAAVVTYLETQEHVAVSPIVFAWLNAAVAATSLLIGLASRIMAVPGVNALLTKIGLGSVPRSAVDIYPDEDTGEPIAHIRRDSTAKG